MKATPSRTRSVATSQLLAAGSSSASDLVMRSLARQALRRAPAPAKIPISTDQRSRHCQTTWPPLRPSSKQVGRAALPKAAGFLEDQFTCAAGSRRYLTYVPASDRTGATRMIVMLHGCTQTAEDFAAGTRMNDFAEEHGFIVV